MNITSIGNRPDQAMLQSRQSGDRGKSGISQELKDKIAKIETGETEQVPDGDQQEKGVVRLLQEGHFQGVADVRLRINFYDQLQLRVAQNSEEVLKTESRELMVELEGQVQALGEDFQVADQVKDQLAAFKQEAEDLLGPSEGEFDSSLVIGGLRDAFAGLLASLQSIAPGDDIDEVETDSLAAEEATLAGSEAPVNVNTAPVTASEAAEPESSTTPAELETFSTALQKLQEWFDAEVAALEKTVDDLQIMPEPGEPRGNGIAYDRFLEIYKELEAGTATSRAHGKA